MQGPGSRLACNAQCATCEGFFVIPMTETRVEGRRLLWDCPTCSTRNRTRLTRRGRLALRAMLRKPGGSKISAEEVREFARSLRDLERAVADELV